MNARRAFVILGAVIFIALAALVVVAVYAHRQMELERNRAKMAPAQRARHAGKENSNSGESAAGGGPLDNVNGAAAPEPGKESPDLVLLNGTD